MPKVFVYLVRWKVGPDECVADRSRARTCDLDASDLVHG